ncbi:MAG: M36 family metallopeptidase [Saprospiraceae bacterium]|nr:M36 family metallopeptidase [Saprospiraceae bacterium]
MVRLLATLFTICLFLSYSEAQIDHSELKTVQKVLKDNAIVTDQLFITDHYTSGGITHTYFKESINGIPIYNSRGAIHYKDKGYVILNQSFQRKGKGLFVANKPALTAIQALDRVAATKGFDRTGEVVVLNSKSGVEQRQTIQASAMSLRDIPAKLEYYYLSENDIKLVWSLPVEEHISAWYTNFLVDANTGEIIKEVDWTVECNHGTPNNKNSKCTIDHAHANTAKTSRRSSSVAPNSYEVFAWPVESPNFGSRTSETTPWNDNLVASPNGWHTIGAESYTASRGNNTDTYIDDDNTNSPTGGDDARAEGGPNLDFFFDLDLDMDPANYKDASVTNTFYWTNLMHDVWFNYGFDEASGNFQEENYTANGNGSDYVYSEAQDGSGSCNANFGTPPDGSNPRMQMYLCTNNGNDRDGDYDNGVIAHEYGHGISNRLTGGPGASGCLSNQEQMGEGWSDYLGLVMTIESGDAGSDARGIGTWLFGQGPNGAGIRPFPYSTDFGVNPMTYNTIKTVSVPHGVGSVWSTMLWDMTWALIDEHGFDADIYNGTGGNNIAMQLVMEGMKLQPCSPGFVDGRNAILEADELLYEGANSCLIWNAFAKRGLGFSALQGSTGSRSDGTEAFDLPPSCTLDIKKSTPTTTAIEDDQVTYQIIVENNFPDLDLTNVSVTDTIPEELSFISASGGGAESGGVVSFLIASLTAGQTISFDITLEVKNNLSYVISDIFDDVESGTGNWSTSFTGSTSWATQTDQSFSGTTAWFAPDNNTPGTAYLDLALEVGLGSGSEMAFYHQYDTENNWDGGQVFISTDKGVKWTDLGSNMIENGYNNVVFNSIPGFSGNSNGFINTIVDLDEYDGQNVLIRFQMNCDQSVGGAGWWIDDFTLTNLNLLSINQAVVSSDTMTVDVFSNAIQLIPPASVFQVDVTKNNILCNGETNGEIFVNPSGGSGSFTYAWNDGATSQNRNNLGVGIYRVTISDGVDDVLKVGIISEPPEFNISLEAEDVTNFAGDNGSIEVLPSGGVGNYTYLWETGATTAEITNLTPGVYTVSVTDEAGCEKIDSAEVFKYGCGDDHFDSGGSNSDYSNLEDMTVVICSDSPDEDVVLTFNSMDIESTWDALYVHNGNSINSPIFDSGNPATQAGFPAGGYYGTTAPGPFAATNESGCITLRFRSDTFVTGDGWDIDISCAIACAPEVMNINSDGYGSLQRQILCADPIDVIQVGSDVFGESITLDEPILIDKELILDPGSGNSFNILSNENGPIFTIAPSGSFELNHLVLIAGQMDPGGAIINNGKLILKNVDVYENEENSGVEGLILNNGQLFIRGNSNLRKE